MYTGLKINYFSTWKKQAEVFQTDANQKREYSSLSSQEYQILYPLFVCARCNELCCSLLQDIYIPGGQVLQVWCQTTAIILDSQGRTSLWVVQEDTAKHARECRGQRCGTASGFACKSPSFAAQGAVHALLVGGESLPSGNGLFSWRCHCTGCSLLLPQHSKAGSMAVSAAGGHPKKHSTDAGGCMAVWLRPRGTQGCWGGGGRAGLEAPAV